MDDVQILCPKMKCEEIFPFAFVNSSKDGDKKYFSISCEYPNASALSAGVKNKHVNKNGGGPDKNNVNLFGPSGEGGSIRSTNTNGKKLPPIAPNKNKKDVKGMDDFMDLLNNSSVASSPDKNNNQYTSEKNNMEAGPTIIEDSKEEDEYQEGQERKIIKDENDKIEKRDSLPGFSG